MGSKTAWSFGAALVVLGLSAGACDNTGDVLTPRPPSSTAVGGAPSASSAGGAGGGEASSSSAGGAKPSFPVRLGLRANPSTAPVAPGDDAALLADLQALAAGVRVVVIEVPFDDVDAAVIATEVERYRGRGLSVVVQLLVVDRRVSRNPYPSFDWSDAVVQSALDAAVTAIVAAGQMPDPMDPNTMLPGVDAVILGRDVGVYLDDNPGEAASLSAFLAGGVTALQDASIPVGIGLSYRQPATANDVGLAQQGDLLAMSYFPALAVDSPTEVATPGQDLDAMIELADERAIFLSAVGFSSALATGMDETQQRQRLAGFFTALEPRREKVSTVVVHQLHDLDDDGCTALAAARGEAPTGTWADVVCGTGLRASDGSAKASWGRFLEAAASLSSP